ncbi:hypothetical protein [Spiroplasma endosymbiont of Lonchoptera lutea]|uniref:hypothetical protein n=1 Tax=Spiroplasma endosymbiont of Lonchoptera lutea TaxID=3066297 RepID=UPI0030D5C2BE
MWKKSLLVLSLASAMFASACKSNDIKFVKSRIYEFSLSKATINWQDSSSKRYLVGFSNFNKNELVNLPENMIYSITWYPSFRFTQKTISDLLTNVYDLTKPGKVDAISIKGKIHSYNTGTSETGIGADWQYDWLELMFTSSPLPEKDNEQPLPNQLKI